MKTYKAIIVPTVSGGNIEVCVSANNTAQAIGLIKTLDLFVVQDILGHSKKTTTQRYAHPVPQKKLDAVEILNTYTN